MQNFFQTPKPTGSLVKLTAHDNFAILRSQNAESESFPEWCSVHFPESIRVVEYITEIPSGPLQGNLTIEGPLTDSQDWNGFWRFFACSPNLLKESISRQLTPFLVASETESRTQLVSISIVGSEYILRVKRGEVSDIVSITQVRPSLVFCDSDLRSRVKNKSGNRFLVHGVEYGWKPKEGLGWHAFDFHVNACTDRCMQYIVLNLELAGLDYLVIYGVDFVTLSNFLRLFALRFKTLKLILVASALMNVDPKLVESFDSRCVIPMNESNTELPKQIQKPLVLPCVSGIPAAALEVAESYFITPLTNAERVKSFAQVLPNLLSPKILIHGPPQSGKSTLAKWIGASVINAAPHITLFEVHASALFSKYLGSSEKRIEKIFRKAALSAPSIIIIEGLHSLCPSRDADDGGETGVADTYQRVLATFLMCLDGFETRDNQVSVIGTSLLSPELLDPAAVRPGRMETWISLTPLES